MSPDLLEAATVLAEVLAQENAALKRLDFPAAVGFGQVKEAALRDITKRRPATPIPTPQPALIDIARQVNRLLAENRALLERAIGVQTRIVGIIVRAATPPPASIRYAASGLKSQSRRASAVTLSARA